MRIVSGQFKGRKFSPPNNLPTRPTTDQAKEAIFNIFNNNFEFENLAVLDLFTGTGNITFEFASRGVTDITCVEQNFKCCDFIKTTSEVLGISPRIIKADVFKWVEQNKGKKFDIIFADPPYELPHLKTIPALIFNAGILKEGGWLVLEHPKEISFSGEENFAWHRNYGHVNFSVFEVTTS
ncbi:MAG: RsmD family RNA methyltransferase [Bacteroidetes bacterium]|nr:RsmD family RNA methyltransferase [Bacteroidota bacterium]